MTTTARILAGWIAVVASLSAGVAFAGALHSATAVVAGTMCVGQAESSDTPPEERKNQVGNLLRRARQALAENDLAAADTLISQAEALKVPYGPLSLGDTPKKARRDLEQKRAAGKGSPKRPSQLFSPNSPGYDSKIPSTDPFARRSSKQPDEGKPDAMGVVAGSAGPPRNAPRQSIEPSGGVPSLPPADLSEVASPLGRSTATTSAGPPRNVPRQSIEPSGAVPSLPPADLSEVASPFGRSIATTPLLDGESPGELPPALAQGTSVERAASAATSGGSHTNDLLRAARRALAVGDVRRAASLAIQARSQQASYGPLDDSPDKVEAAIRKYQEVTAQQGNSEAYRRTYARMLLEQAAALLRSGDHDEAERLATQASRQQLTYGPFEAKPEEMLARIAAARRQDRKSATPPSSETPAAESAAAPMVSPTVQGEAKELIRQARDAGTIAPAARAAAPATEITALAGSAVTPAGSAVASAIGVEELPQPLSSAVSNPASDPTQNMLAAGEQPAVPLDPRDLNAAEPVPIPAEPVPAERVPTRAEQVPAPAEQVPTPAKPKKMPAPPSSLSPGDGPPPSATGPREGVALSLFRQGEDALKAHQVDRAIQFFRQAALYMNELDPATAQRLKDYLQLLSVPGPNRQGVAPPKSLAEETASKQSILARQIFSEIARQESAAKTLRETDAKGALNLLEETRKKVEAAELEPGAREALLRRVDRSLSDLRQFIEENRPRIELEEKNQRIRQEVDREQRVKLENQQKIAAMVDEFHRLMDEQRWAEAEVVAKRAAELDPKNPVVQHLLWVGKFTRRVMNNKDVEGEKEELFWKAMANVDKSSVPFDDLNPYQHGDAKKWQELTKGRSKMLAERGRRRSERELEIERKLKTPVSLQFPNAALSKVIEYLGKVAEVNIYLDPQGLAQEGVNSDTPVSIEVRDAIMLKSVLNLLLQPLHLSYVIKDEVLKITSEQLRDGQVETRTYNVADLIVPIPNFVPNPHMGLEGAYHNAMANVGFGGPGSFGAASTPLAVVASKEGNPNNTTINPTIFAQMAGTHSQTGALQRSTPAGSGPGGLGGGAQADFDSLINLITSTIQPTTWQETGGPGSIEPFDTNLSIVVSNTQEVHEEIVDLLEQLRRMQDLQVTIEVRFVTLNDDFFERMGVSFEFNVDSNIDTKGPAFHFGQIVSPGDPTTQTAALRDTLHTDNDAAKRVTVGLSAAPRTFSADLEIPFTQNTFALTNPQFGTFNPGDAANLGFAILSDIEAYFFIQALQRDTRNNVMQAPKVTLFNGQQAMVADQSQQPFVMSVVPVVGDFAAAQQPVIVVLSEGTFMTVQAVVSNDRRFVRLTVVPFFSKIGKDVNTFQFTGSETTTTDTSAEGWVNGSDPNNSRRNNSRNAATTTRSGTTVQLPTFSFVTVTTTVSVPDGGTVLLGGIKRLSEGRDEAGIPILDKLPYLNRLFKNTGISRTTQSLMMMVTPHIIIQEEEEEKLGVLPP